MAHDAASREPFHMALRGQETKLRLLLDTGTVQVNQRREGGLYPGWTMMHAAANEGHHGVVEVLIESGARPDPENDNGQTPIDMAELKGHASIIALLQTVMQQGPYEAHDARIGKAAHAPSTPLAPPQSNMGIARPHRGAPARPPPTGILSPPPKLHEQPPPSSRSRQASRAHQSGTAHGGQPSSSSRGGGKERAKRAPTPNYTPQLCASAGWTAADQLCPRAASVGEAEEHWAWVPPRGHWPSGSPRRQRKIWDSSTAAVSGTLAYSPPPGPNVASNVLTCKGIM